MASKTIEHPKSTLPAFSGLSAHASALLTAELKCRANLTTVGVRTGSENGTAVLTGFSIKTAVKKRFLRFLGIYLIKLKNYIYC